MNYSVNTIVPVEEGYYSIDSTASEIVKTVKDYLIDGGRLFDSVCVCLNLEEDDNVLPIVVVSGLPEEESEEQKAMIVYEMEMAKHKFDRFIFAVYSTGSVIECAPGCMVMTIRGYKNPLTYCLVKR